VIRNPAIVVFLSLLASATILAGQLDRDISRRSEADQRFEVGDYAAAEPLYRKHAMKGDKFSQYRMGLIHYFGLTGSVDKVEAFAWLTTAQEPQLISLRQFATLVSTELTKEQIGSARERLIDYDRKYGAVQEVELDPSKKVDCTGSRLGRNCEFVARPIERTAANDSTGFYDVELAPNVITTDELNRFQALYGDQILQEFARFDTLAGQ